MTIKVHVDMDKCQFHGQCAIAAPDVFRINDDGELEYETQVPDDLLDEVEDAIDVCPLQVILIKD